MGSELAKTSLALAWHIGDAILDGMNAPKKARLALAGIGVLWASFFLVRELTKETWHEADMKVANHLRRK